MKKMMWLGALVALTLNSGCGASQKMYDLSQKVAQPEAAIGLVMKQPKIVLRGSSVPLPGELANLHTLVAQELSAQLGVPVKVYSARSGWNIRKTPEPIQGEPSITGVWNEGKATKKPFKHTYTFNLNVSLKIKGEDEVTRSGNFTFRSSNGGISRTLATVPNGVFIASGGRRNLGFLNGKLKVARLHKRALEKIRAGVRDFARDIKTAEKPSG